MIRKELLYLLSRPAKFESGSRLGGVREEMTTLHNRTEAEVEAICASLSPFFKFFISLSKAYYIINSFH